MRVKVTELSPAELDYWAAKVEGYVITTPYGQPVRVVPKSEIGQPQNAARRFSPTTNYHEAAPLIIRESIKASIGGGHWSAWVDRKGAGGAVVPPLSYGDTHLIASLRCFITLICGVDVEIPNEEKADGQ